MLDAHVENIRVEWSSAYPSRVFATAPKRFLFYKHLGTGIYNDTGLLHGPLALAKPLSAVPSPTRSSPTPSC